MRKKIWAIVSAVVLMAIIICTTNIVAKGNNSTITANVEKGIQALKSENVDRAMYYFEKELDRNPQNGYAWFWVNITKNYCREINTALDAANNAIEYLPRMERLCLYGASRYVRCQGRKRIGRGRL